MKFIVLAETDQVAQQAFLFDLRADIGDLHAAPVRLAGDQAIRLEQMRHQGLFYRTIGVVRAQELGRRHVLVDLQVEAIEQGAFQLAHLERAEGVRRGDLHVHRRAERGGQVLAQQFG